jgi:tetratricopeptide (TPR) repeat protein
LLAIGAAKTWSRVKKIPRDIGGTANSTKAAFVLGSIGGLTAILLHSAVDFNMHIPANAVLAVVWMALLTSHLRFATESHWFTAGTGRKALVSLLLILGLIGIGIQAWQRGSENIWLTRAARFQRHDPAHIEMLKRAFQADAANFQTAFDIGEALRFRSMQGVEDYEELAKEALEWYQRAFKLNRWEGNAPLMAGWCLDWLGRTQESPFYFDAAEKLDPNSYFTMAHIGLHYVETGELAASRAWFERSLRLQQEDNPIASSYLLLVTARLMEAATNAAAAPR